MFELALRTLLALDILLLLVHEIWLRIPRSRALLLVGALLSTALARVLLSIRALLILFSRVFLVTSSSRSEHLD